MFTLLVISHDKHLCTEKLFCYVNSGRIIKINLIKKKYICHRFRPAWGLHPSIDAEYVMEHTGENFITSELMLGFVTSESYFDFTENEIMV